eukprot:1145626-Pelagomonas_calceolata.AAC.1
MQWTALIGIPCMHVMECIGCTVKMAGVRQTDSILHHGISTAKQRASHFNRFVSYAMPCAIILP